jgi:vesicle-associated membrane protein-associated protein A
VPEAAPAPVREREIDEELLAKYIASQKEIERLRALLATIPEPAPTSPISETTEAEPEPELRRRRRPLSEYEDESTVYRAESDVGTSYSDRRYAPQPEGVPLQVVVGIAFGVFLMTYMFF